MNENIDLVKILKNCPKGTKFYTTVWGDVEFEYLIEESDYPIHIKTRNRNESRAIRNSGRLSFAIDAECIIFPSKDQRDWGKFTAPWYKKERFDPCTLQPFDKVLVRDEYKECWCYDFFSHMRRDLQAVYKCATTKSYYRCCIPYNDETKHLAGTKDEAPEYYRYWEV